MEIYASNPILKNAKAVVKIRPFRYGNSENIAFNSSSATFLISSLKSDRFGMEILTSSLIGFKTLPLKSDRFGMEILLLRLLLY